MSTELVGVRTGMYAAYAAAVLFIALFAAFSMPTLAPIAPYLGITIHWLLFPVVAAVPATSWGRAAGYGWLVIDNVAGMLAINGVDFAMTVRLGGHLSAAVWVLAASLLAEGWHRALGIFVAAVVFGAVSLIPANAFEWSRWLLPAGLPLFVIWLGNAGYRLRGR